MIDLETQDLVNKGLVQLGKKLNIPFVLTNDVHFLRRGEHKLQKILMEIATKGKFSYDAPENYLKSLKEWEEIRRDRKSIPKDIFNKAIDNCFKIADECNYTISTGNLYFPTFNHKTHSLYKKFKGKKEEFFRRMILGRAKDILGKNFSKKVYQQRIIEEYKILIKLGGLDYFLIVDDLLYYIRKQGAFSLIRGSANGSLIAFILGFGLIDPIKHNIMFERFISKYRSLNDIDIDIDLMSEFRSKAISYLKEKYGEESIISIGTYGRLQLKASIKDVTRVLKDRLDNKIERAKTEEEADKLTKKQEKYSYPIINKITSVMNDGLTIEEAKNNYALFEGWYNENKKLVDRLIAPLIGI
ncbi:MAG: hypothetical protein ABGF52_02685 [Candidatus Asgardarchaeum sp.]